MKVYRAEHTASEPNADVTSRHQWRHRLPYAFLVLLLGVVLSICNISSHCKRLSREKDLYHSASASYRFNSCKSQETTRLDIGEEFDWNDALPSPALKWTRCYDRFQCTRLDVPLDYTNQTGERAAIALIRLPSARAPDAEGYRGPILFNPGGPGLSGVDFMLESPDDLRAILGDEFDLLGFDPRGVGRSSPSLKPFRTKAEAGAFLLQHPENVNASDVALSNSYASSLLLGRLVKERDRRTAQHMSTPTVARDMLSIVEAHGRDKLQYWGFSYGTALGATFAAMFPDRIERMILDGVLDAENYYKAERSNNLRDSNATLFDFYRACHAAGPEHCPIYEYTPELIHTRVDRLLQSLRTEPIPFHRASDNTHTVIDFAVGKGVLFRAMLAPHILGVHAAHALAALERGDAGMMWDVAQRRETLALLACDCEHADGAYGGMAERTLAVACGDGDVVGDSLSEIKAFYEHTMRLSYFGDSWHTHIGCAGWRVRPVEPFKGSFVQNTSHPILLIGNIADPLTPLEFAHRMTRGFAGSVVLTQNSPGHCSLAAVSLCTSKAIRSYFKDGILPAYGSTCEVESSIFGPGVMQNFGVNNITMEDQELLKASERLHVKFTDFVLRTITL